VLVREGLLPNKLRVTAGTVEETSAFLDALEEILKENP
jgi:histidinol-phosphate/aromatic aminotransferase/cobyric acid decarboxylase-like protein